MTGRPGYRTMEMNGGSSAPYLARAPCVPLFVHCLLRVEAEGLLDYQGRAGIISVVRWNLRPVIFGVDKGIPPRENGKKTPHTTQAHPQKLEGLGSLPSLVGGILWRASHKEEPPTFDLHFLKRAHTKGSYSPKRVRFCLLSALVELPSLFLEPLLRSLPRNVPPFIKIYGKTSSKSPLVSTLESIL